MKGKEDDEKFYAKDIPQKTKKNLYDYVFLMYVIQKKVCKSDRQAVNKYVVLGRNIKEPS